MTMPYAHISLAHGCLDYLDVADRDEFYLGAISPDMRYFTRRPREQYHISLERLDELVLQSNASESFVLGYKVHLIVDEIWYTEEMNNHYRNMFISPIRKMLSPKLLESALEYFCLTKRPVSTRLKVRENGLMQRLDVTLEDVTKAVNAMQTYIDRRSLQIGLDIAQGTGLYSNERLDQMRALSSMVENSRIRRLLVDIIVNPPSKQIYNYIITQVRKRLAESSVATKA